MNLASPALRRTVAPSAAALSLALLIACGGEPHGAPVPATLSDVRRHSVHVGLADDGPDQAALGQVVAARLTEGGRHLVVLDFVAPFIKVYDRAGRFQTAFMARGGGPGEGRSPTALAVSGDSLILVAEPGQGLTVFDLRGNVRAHAVLPQMVPLAAAAVCPGEWLVYGPRYDRGRGSASWLHRVRLAAQGEPRIESMLVDSVPRYLSAGLAYGMVAEGGQAVVRHTASGHSSVLRLACGQAQPQVVRQLESAAGRDPERQDDKLRTSVSSGMRAPAGVAAVDGAVVFGDKVYVGHGEDRLDLTYVTRGTQRSLSLAGDYVLQDSRPGLGVLVSTSKPTPQVFLVRPADFVKMFPRGG